MLKEAIRILNPAYGYDSARAIMEQALQVTKYTPDIEFLESKERHLLFVHDELKKDHTQHRRLGQQSIPFFPAFTQSSFRYWENSNPLEHRVPMLEDKQVGILNQFVYYPPVAKIKGEVYAIRPETFLDLDTYKENTVQFIRQRVRLIVPYRKVLWLKDKSLWPASEEADPRWRELAEHCHSSIVHTREKTCIIRAWMYIGNPSFWDPILGAFDWHSVENHHSKNRRWCETYYNIRRPRLPPK